MGVFDIYSKRQKIRRGEVTDVYTYDSIPEPLKVQIIHIWHDVLGSQTDLENDRGEVARTYSWIVQTLRREYGVFALVPNVRSGPVTELKEFLLRESDVDKILDVVEITFRCIDRLTRKHSYLIRSNYEERADGAIEELNLRFKEHAVGYQYVEAEIVRVDSQLLHAEVVLPALALLHEAKYEGAQEEFLKAHEHHRHGNNKETLAECLKAFESVMKVICAEHGWTHDANATSKALIKTLFDKGLIPEFWQSHFAGLRTTLESGVPTARNRLGGHGQGTDVTEVPDHLVSYVLHMTASTIVFLVEASKRMSDE